MSCIQIDDDVLVGNIIASSAGRTMPIDKVSLQDIQNCGIFLENNLPGYVDCDVNAKSVYQTARGYGCIVEEDTNTILINAKDPDSVKKRCNGYYSQTIAEQIERLVGQFLEERSDRENITRMKYVVAK